MTAILLTGAAGRIGQMMQARLPGYGWSLRLLDRTAVDGTVGDIADPATWDDALAEPVAAIVHLAGQPNEGPWPVVRESNLDGLYQCFEAARRHGVPRVVFASSNHAVGFTPRGPGELAADSPPRPDTLYGASKIFGEALGRYYVDRYGLDVACLRIGTCSPTPPNHRALASWLSPDDCARLVDAALRHDPLGYRLVWGVSANTRRWWSLDAGRAIGYEPRDDAEAYAAQLPDYGPESDDLVGGEFTTAAYGIEEVLHRA